MNTKRSIEIYRAGNKSFQNKKWDLQIGNKSDYDDAFQDGAEWADNHTNFHKVADGDLPKESGYNFLCIWVSPSYRSAIQGYDVDLNEWIIPPFGDKGDIPECWIDLEKTNIK